MARQRKSFKQGFVRRTQQESADIAALEATIAAGAPAPGTNVVGTAAPHPSDTAQTAAPETIARGQNQPHSKRAARAEAAQARLPGSKGWPTAGAAGDHPGEKDSADPGAGYAHAKLFTELPLSRHTQVREYRSSSLTPSPDLAWGIVCQPWGMS